MTDHDPPEDAAALRAQLSAEIERRRERDRELVEQRARADAAEAQLGNIRLTLSYGLGQALVEALTLRGLLRLPMRIMELRKRQQAKRGRLPAHYAGIRAAEAMRMVPQDIEAMDRDALIAAARDLQGGSPVERARALAEIALALVRFDPAEALRIGEEAAVVRPDEPRLFNLAMALHGAGMLDGPLRLLERIEGKLPFSTAMSARLNAIRAEAAAPAPYPGRPERMQSAGNVLVVIGEEAFSDGGADAYRAFAAARSAACQLFVVTAEVGEVRSFERSGVIVSVGGAADLPGSTGIAHVVGLEMEVPVRHLLAQGTRVLIDTMYVPVVEGTERAVARGVRLAALLAAADRVIVRSEAAAVEIARLIPDANPLVVPSEIPVLEIGEERLTDLRRELDLRPERPVIVCAGPLIDDPGLFDLIEAHADVGRPDLTLLFIGTGPAAPALARAAARRGISRNVIFAGTIRPEDMPAYLALGQIVAVPHRGEAARRAAEALVFAEAIGVPCAASSAAWAWSGLPNQVAADDREAMVTILSGPLPRTTRSERQQTPDFSAIYAAMQH
ncbi:glycosyltransferase [Sphingomonas sp. ID0503]|uniref:glycosyltransferase n=1 Tax=Sphingomonas sp. ID0503 TaxID=3399691 RepID=UPI003AFB6607